MIQPINSKTLEETFEVSLVQVNGTAYYVEIISDELQLDIHEGKLLKLNMTSLKATLDDFESYDLAPDVAVTDSEGRGLSLGAYRDMAVRFNYVKARSSKPINIRPSLLSKYPLIKQQGRDPNT